MFASQVPWPGRGVGAEVGVVERRPNEKIYNSGLLCLFTLSPSCLVGGGETERGRREGGMEGGGVGPTWSDRGGGVGGVGFGGGWGGMGAHPASCAKKLPTTAVGSVEGSRDGREVGRGAALVLGWLDLQQQ